MKITHYPPGSLSDYTPIHPEPPKETGRWIFKVLEFFGSLFDDMKQADIEEERSTKYPKVKK